jgi:hypothetical protein
MQGQSGRQQAGEKHTSQHVCDAAFLVEMGTPVESVALLASTRMLATKMVCRARCMVADIKQQERETCQFAGICCDAAGEHAAWGRPTFAQRHLPAKKNDKQPILAALTSGLPGR